MPYLEHKRDSIHRNYTIVYHKKQNEWRLLRRGVPVFSGTKKGVNHWYEKIILPNNPMF